MALYCHACGAELDIVGAVGRRDACLACRADLHACAGCVAYAPDTVKQCREPFADPPSDKRASNACDYFQYAPDKLPESSKDTRAEALRRLEDLFKKK